ncbi:hypothetical protein HPB52_003231 [Rhipicephalus sanguineus]|uniref:Retropepsins domain-containing protein n=1 Tax=Rhipicephalus sanguineus TaxID=34632 RepID=A0A9D4PQD9_RHISA|nr:hypothetical protein HPB52_003231 [Rhipicephalus sanguineus]
MASPIPPPLFLSTPGDPPIPWADWKLIFEAYVDAIGNDARKPERRKALLLNALGHAGLKLYQTLSSANASETPASADVFQAALALFDDHFKDASCDYVARLRFQERRQLPGEPVVDFIASLRSLAASCGFGALENDMIRQQLFIGVASQNVRCRLLQKGSSITLSEALSIAREDELVRVQLEQFAPHSVQQLSAAGGQGAGPLFHGTRQHGGPSSSTAQTNTVTVLNVDGLHTSSEPRVTASVGNVPLSFLVDTGASVSLINADDFKHSFPHIQLARSSTVLHSYSKGIIRHFGQFTANVTYAGVQAPITFFVTPCGRSLLGLDAIRLFGITICVFQSHGFCAVHCVTAFGFDDIIFVDAGSTCCCVCFTWCGVPCACACASVYFRNASASHECRCACARASVHFADASASQACPTATSTFSLWDASFARWGGLAKRV